MPSRKKPCREPYQVLDQPGLSRLEEAILPDTEGDDRWRWPIACAVIVLLSTSLWALIGLVAHQLGLI